MIPQNIQIEKSETQRWKNLLIVEDEIPAGKALSELLKLQGYEASLVTSGRGAVNEVYRVGEDIGVILMDINMEGEIDGIEAVIEIQKEYSKLPVILVTAYAGIKNYRQRVTEANLEIVGWVDKPITGDNEKRLITLIEMAIMKQKDAIKEEVRNQIKSKLSRNMSSSMIQTLMEELCSTYGIEFLLKVIQDIEIIKPPRRINIDEIYPHLNFIAYQSMKNELEEKYPGKFVAFLDGGMVGNSWSKDDLIKTVYEDYSRTDIFITKISGEEKVIKIRRPKRVIR